ncbi:reticulophagy regulator 3 [Thalassophryne amazonica]|uniref:reticulophagy regulator 3 n=1 Tax=Thalassophryne amazonica TaxID=390379 RepID=UPI0014718509|nr:reticulophagy regulator 3 [Thalassophryne amazonica]XP_034045806.1 reticulophagy regulator 3 [Thalassophryne amazonica]XP_034045807.1 reticulophagy regulator 3 [Thalassophryne amazonica]
MEGASGDDYPGTQGSNVCLRRRTSSSDRDDRVRAVTAALQSRFGPYEPVLTYLQSVLVWERPVHCVLLYAVVNVVFWFFALTSLRLLFLLASGLAVVVFLDAWKNKIWPEIRVRTSEESESESWGLVQPGVLSVPELCHHIAEAWVSGVVLTSSALQYKRLNPGKFCILTCAVFTCLAMVGRCIPGLVLSYCAVLVVLLTPLAAYHRIFQHVSPKLEPVLQRLDFSVRGYMMSKPMDNQFLRGPIYGAASNEASDSEEELAAFCPSFDDAAVAKELALTDSEHSDAEVSYTDNGTFNLSRGQTPLTEGSEDFDRHSDAEESFAQDLPDFPSINPDATLMDDDDDTSIGLPSLGLSGLSSHRASVLDVEAHLDSDQEDLDAELSLGGLPPASGFTGDIAGFIASNMIQMALAGALQPRLPAAPRREGSPRAAAHRSYRTQSSSELDTDLDGDDFEMLDQSELNQMDPVGGGGVARQGGSQGSNFLSNLLGKPQ